VTTVPARPDSWPDSQLDLDIRRRADASSRRPALLAFTTALAWLLAGSLFGDVASLKLHLPDWLVTHGWLTFGRIRVAHLNAMIYGWASLAMLGVSLWMIPRLVHAQLRYGRLAELGIWLWNIGVLLGVGAVLAGRTDGLEWLEMARYMADPWLVVGGGMVGVALLVAAAACSET
jgi:cytochrome c oxidase cbb3-type subunit I